MEIVRSVELIEIDPVFYDTSYYVVPERGGERAYALLFAALRQTQRVAIARVGMNGREHVMVVRCGTKGLLAHTMFFVDELRSETEHHAKLDGLNPKELDLATMFLNAIAAPFAPEEFTDGYKEQLQALISEKLAASNIAPVLPTPTIDIMEALKQSVAARQQAAEPSKKAPGRVTELKKRHAHKAK